LAKGMQAYKEAEAMRVAPGSASPTIASALRPAKCQETDRTTRVVTAWVANPVTRRASP